MNILHAIITRPLGIMLMWLYEFLGSYGLTLIVFTVLYRLLMFPLQLKSKRSTYKMGLIQPQIAEIQKQYKDNPQLLNQEMAKVYKENNISMMGGCLPMLLTLPLMIALYYAVGRPLTFMMGVGDATIQQIADTLGFTITNLLTDQIPLANLIFENFDQVKHISDLIQPIDFSFLGLQLSQKPELSSPSLLWAIPILSGATAFLSSFVTMRLTPKPAGGQQMGGQMKSMMYMMPLMSVYFCFIMPAGIGLYWIVGNLMMVVQEVVLNAYLKRETAKEEEKKKCGREAALSRELEEKQKKQQLLKESGAKENKNISQKKIRQQVKAKKESQEKEHEKRLEEKRLEKIARQEGDRGEGDVLTLSPEEVEVADIPAAPGKAGDVIEGEATVIDEEGDA